MKRLMVGVVPFGEPMLEAGFRQFIQYLRFQKNGHFWVRFLHRLGDVWARGWGSTDQLQTPDMVVCFRPDDRTITLKSPDGFTSVIPLSATKEEWLISLSGVATRWWRITQGLEV